MRRDFARPEGHGRGDGANDSLLGASVLLFGLQLFGGDATPRYGEALHPGPAEETLFHLGTVNVAGATNKIEAISELPFGHWGLTEAHLTEVGIRSFRSSFVGSRRCNNRLGKLAFGAPVPPRSLESTAGTWAGTLSASDLPIRLLRSSGDSLPYLSGRLHYVSLMVNGIQITGACLYGAAQGPTYADAVQITTDIQQDVSDTLFRAHQGPRFIMGDFNTQLMETLPTQQWYDAGWREIQQHLNEKMQRPILPTCKKATTRDFVWISPELLPFVVDGGILEDLFPDHDPVYALLRLPSSAKTISRWPMPTTLDWSQVHTQSWHDSCNKLPRHHWHTDMTKSFATWSRRVESSLRGHYHNDSMAPPAAALGRGQALRPRTSLPQQPHAKPARPGEEALQSSFINRAVHCRYKQLRRLQALLHNLRKKSASPNAQAYASQLWSSIVTAKGFHPTFRSWWPTRLVHLQGSLVQIPPYCPSLDDLELIFLDYKRNFRAFESWHIAQKAKIIQTRREQSSRELFKPLKKDVTSPIDLLYKTSRALVIDMDPMRDQICISPVLHLDQGFVVHSELQISMTFLSYFAEDADAGWYQLHGGKLPCVGDELIHKIPCTSLQDIQAELHALWLPRWQMSADIPDELWTRITNFARAYLPCGSLPCPAITGDALLRTLGHGRGLRTRGPDAWSKSDLKALPMCFRDELADMYSCIERGAPWPQQVVRGHVTCLEKVQGAELASQFRPVVLYGLPYRLWSSFRSRMLIPALTKMANFHAFGYLSGRSSTQLTFEIQATIEAALATTETLVGVTTDIEKCFNYLQRKPVMYMAKILGVSPLILAAWQSFLDLMTRAFVVQQEVGGSHCSSNGFPEGDSLSCIGLLVMTFSLHHYMRVYAPAVDTWSYVDNLQLVGLDAGVVQQSFLVMQTWAQLFGLKLDVAKTVYWSTDAQARQALRAAGCSVTEFAKDLGISMVYGTRLLNAPIRQRILATEPHRKRLRLMRVATWYKVLAIRMALLPRALYGASHVRFGRCWITKLRSGAMKALRWNRPGANPALRLACIAPVQTDPGYYEASLTLREFQTNLQISSTMRTQWYRYSTRTFTRQTHGPFAKIEELCHLLCWQIDEMAVLHLPDGFNFSLLQKTHEACEMVLSYAWFQHVARGLLHRKDFHGLVGIDHHASFHQRKKLSLSDQALLHCIQDGTFHLRSYKSKFDATVDPQCPHCSVPDTTRHRAVDCPFYAGVRSNFMDCIAVWDDFSVALTHHGIASANPAQWRYWAELEVLPDQPQWHAYPTREGVQHVFTDACGRKRPTCRYALGQ